VIASPRTGLAVHAPSVRHGQRHLELDAADRVSQALGAAHKTVNVDPRSIGGSASPMTRRAD
jgi:7-cyano-7-deazaguanine synthase